MKVWPPGKPQTPGLEALPTAGLDNRSPLTADLANWVLADEKLLVETRFNGSRERYGAWRDHLWTEMNDPTRHLAHGTRPTPDEEYVVMTAFEGNWAQYRICRDRLREELWQIMKVINRR